MRDGAEYVLTLDVRCRSYIEPQPFEEDPRDVLPVSPMNMDRLF